MSPHAANLKHFRLLIGKNQREFAHSLGVTQSTLSSAERGRRPVSEKLIHSIEFTYKPHAGFFNEPIMFYNAPDLLFRTARQGQAQAEQIATAFSIAEHYLQKAYSDVVSDLPKLPIPDASKPLDQATLEHLAQLTRTHFGLDDSSPIINITEILHYHGILVTALPDYVVDETNFDGVSSPHNKSPRVIALNRKNRSGDRYRFSLAHELGHLVLHTDTPRSDRAAIETEANIFAGAFLMPKALLETTITNELTLKDYAELKQRWGYSIQAIIRRSHELNLINYKRYRSLRMQISGRGWSIKEPGTVLLENLHTIPIDILDKNQPHPTSEETAIATVTTLPLQRAHIRRKTNHTSTTPKSDNPTNP